ncbi:MAG: hypothetical protein AAGF84_08950 [Planctomycetota bacterium]
MAVSLSGHPERAKLLDGRTLWRGAVGLMKLAVRAEPVSDEVRQDRRAACAKCPEAKQVKRVGALSVLTATSSCGVCRCNLRAKTRLEGEACPLGKW